MDLIFFYFLKKIKKMIYLDLWFIFPSEYIYMILISLTWNKFSLYWANHQHHKSEIEQCIYRAQSLRNCFKLSCVLLSTWHQAA